MKASLSFPNDQTIPNCIIDLQSELQFAGHYEFNLHVCYPANIKPKQCLWKHASLSINDKAVLGIVTKVLVDTQFTTNETVVYQFHFESPLALLKQHSHVRSWVGPDAKTLFNELLLKQGIHYKIRDEIKFDDSVCQYHQTDFEFLNKLSESSQFSYQFDMRSPYPVLNLYQQEKVSTPTDQFPLLSATVVNTDDHQAYQLVYSFGENVRTPLLQPHPSNHWPLQVKQSVYTGCYEGEYHRPFVLGRYDLSAKHDGRWNRFMSDGAQTFVSCNGIERSYLELQQPKYENQILLQKEPTKTLEIKAKQHRLLYYLKGKLVQTSRKSIYQIAYKSHVEASIIDWRATECLSFSSAKRLSIDANRLFISSKFIDVASKQDLILKSDNIIVQTNNCQFRSSETTKLHAEQSIIICANAISLGSRAAGIHLASGGINVSGHQVLFNAGSVNLYGQWTGVSGSAGWIGHLVQLSHAKKHAVKHVQIHNLLYIPAKSSFVLLDTQEAKKFDQEAQHWDHLIQSVHESKNKEHAKHVLTKHLAQLVRAPDKMKLCEVLSFGGKKWSYVSSQTVGNPIRRYQIDQSSQSELVTGGKLDFHKIQTRFDRLFDGVEKFDWSPFKADYHDAFQWANDWNKRFHHSWWGQYKQLSYHVDSSAQLLRYLIGISYKHTQHLEQLSFSFHATTHVNVDIANAQCQVSAYLPGEQGYPLTLSCKDRHDQDIIYHLGAMRIEGHFTLSGYAGCSILANTHLSIKPHHGALQLLGRNFATQDIDAFAGVKVGVELLGDICWKNPQQDEWLGFASTGYKVDIAAGIGAKFGFYISYEHGKFIIRMKAGLICGAGVEGEMICTVTSKHILEFTKFVYEQLKQHDFSYLYFIEQTAFEYLTHAQMYHLYHVDTGYLDMPAIITWWQQFQRQWNVTHHRDVIADRWQAAVDKNRDYINYLYPESNKQLNYILSYSNS